MAKRKNRQTFHTYECSLSGRAFKVTKKAPHPEDLVCVQAYYELNPDMDDRPEAIKVQLTPLKKSESTEVKGSSSSVWDALVELSQRQKAEKEARESARLSAQAQH